MDNNKAANASSKAKQPAPPSKKPSAKASAKDGLAGQKMTMAEKEQQQAKLGQ